MKYVLHSSAAFKWLVPESDAPRAVPLRDEFRAVVHELIAPDALAPKLAHVLTRATDSDNRRPQPGVTIAREVANVHRRDDDLITRLADRGSTGRQDDVSVEGVGRSGGYAALAGVRPESRSLTPLRCRDGDVDQPARRDQIIEPSERGAGPDAHQFPANLAVGDLGDDRADAPHDQPSEPLATAIRKRESMAPAGQPQWPGIEQDELPHDSVASLEEGR